MSQNQLEAFARAYDREDASQRGEPDPWQDGKDDAVWVAERLACAKAALSSLEAAAPSEEPVAYIARGEDDMPERIWAGDFNAEGFGHCVAGMQGGLYAEYVRADLASPAGAPVAWTGHQLAKLNDFKGCLEEHEGMLCASTAKRVREAAIDFALSVVLREAKP